jgi:hypothetical protein
MRVETLDRVVADYGLKRVDMVKVDVDGADYDVLWGGRDVLARFHPLLVVEMEAKQDEIYRLVKQLGYTQCLGMQGEHVVPGKWPPNLIAGTGSLEIPGRGALKTAKPG